MKQIHVLLGGMTGGALDRVPPLNAGMNNLVHMLAPLGVKTWTWGQWQSAWRDIHDNWKSGNQIIIIGYSGGGTRGTWLCNAIKPAPVALLVVYDPSPARQMRPIGNNVRRAVCYHNLSPAMWFPGVGWLGGGIVTGDGSEPTPVIETVPISEWHLAVQFDEKLHRHTMDLINKI